jgi:RNA polymerase sigma factor (TIGR02999 family)
MAGDPDLTTLIRRADDGDTGAAHELFELTYAELRRLARARLRAGGRHTLLDTSALVHESWLRFASDGRLRLEDRTHFMRWAACAMRSVVVDFARRRSAGRRGGAAPHVALDDNVAAGHAPEDEILAVHEALEKIGTFDPRLVQVVELRYFGGLTEAEAAAALGVTDRTIRRDWDKARLLLRELLH